MTVPLFRRFSRWAGFFAASVPLVSLLFSAPNARAEEEQNTGYVTAVLAKDRLADARRRVREGDPLLKPAVDQLCREAGEWLAKGPFSVMEKALTPPSGDKHDYMSFGPYWWPDPAKKNGLPYIRRDGQVNPEAVGPGSDRVALESMAAGAETLALAYYFTGDERYAARSALYIETWFLNPSTRMNPHLNYGQAIPGRTEGRGIGLIETRRFSQIINALALLEESPALTSRDREAVRAWFKAYLQWMRESPNGKQESGEHNNHGTWYDVQVAHFALFTGDRALAQSTVEAALKKRLAVQVREDGAQPDELARTRSFTYSLINLSGLLALAELGREVGVDFWGYPGRGGSLLRRAVDFMAPYADAATPWPHRQITPLNRTDLLPFLRQAQVFSGDARAYEVWCAKLPPKESAEHRANLLWPVSQGASK